MLVTIELPDDWTMQCRRALFGDSNDTEHEVLFGVYESIIEALRKAVA